MTVIPPIIDYESKYGTILCPGCRGIMRPLHWHYPDREPLFTDMFLCTDCGEYIFDKETQECLTFPRNMRDSEQEDKAEKLEAIKEQVIDPELKEAAEYLDTHTKPEPHNVEMARYWLEKGIYGTVLEINKILEASVDG